MYFKIKTFVIFTIIFFSIMAYISTLSKEQQQIALIELNEVPSRMEEDIAHIHKWLSKQHHINARTDDYTLLMFLRNCKFSLEKTKKKLELFYTIKPALPDIFRNRDPLLPFVQLIFQHSLVAVLPETSNGPLTVLVRTEKVTPEVIPLSDFLKMVTMLFDVVLREYEYSTVTGLEFFIDFKHVCPRYFFYVTPTYLNKIAVVFEKAYPVRGKAAHFINFPTVLTSALNILKSFLSKKLQNRVFCHPLGDDNIIGKYVPSSHLPSEYGGTAGSFADLSEKLKFKFEKYRDWLCEDEQFGCFQEKKTSSKVDMDLSSLDGSFRKLEID